MPFREMESIEVSDLKLRESYQVVVLNESQNKIVCIGKAKTIEVDTLDSTLKIRYDSSSIWSLNESIDLQGMFGLYNYTAFYRHEDVGNTIYIRYTG